MIDKYIFENVTHNDSLMNRQRIIMVKIMQILNKVHVTSIETNIEIYSILNNFSGSYNGKIFGIDINVNYELKNNQMVFRNENFKTYEEFLDGDYILELYGDIGFF